MSTSEQGNVYQNPQAVGGVLSGERPDFTVRVVETGDPEANLMMLIKTFVNQSNLANYPERTAKALYHLAEYFNWIHIQNEKQGNINPDWRGEVRKSVWASGGVNSAFKAPLTQGISPAPSLGPSHPKRTHAQYEEDKRREQMIKLMRSKREQMIKLMQSKLGDETIK